jgi:hypothetical protein
MEPPPVNVGVRGAISFTVATSNAVYWADEPTPWKWTTAAALASGTTATIATVTKAAKSNFNFVIC